VDENGKSPDEIEFSSKFQNRKVRRVNERGIFVFQSGVAQF
jgi:hypothetical protein